MTPSPSPLPSARNGDPYSNFRHRQLPWFWLTPESWPKGQRVYGWLWVALLWPLALLWRIGLRFKWLKACYWPQSRVHIPVVVIGNFFVGGTGKTPLTLALARALRARGWQVGIVSRGYGRRLNTGQSAASKHMPHTVKVADAAAVSGDEPKLYAHYLSALNIPIVICRNRNQAALHLYQEYPHTTVILADDGLQHWALARDYEIAVSDGRGFGNGQVMPAGPLREPPRAVDAHFFHQRAAQLSVIERAALGHIKSPLILQGQLGAPYPLAQWGHDSSSGPQQAAWGASPLLESSKVIAWAGIGNPSEFFEALRRLGWQLETTIALPDHYDFPDDFWSRWQSLDRSGLRIVMTEKDAVKCHGAVQKICPDLLPFCWVVPYEVTLPDNWLQGFEQRLTVLAQRTNVRFANSQLASVEKEK